jgi:hypothetical protein
MTDEGGGVAQGQSLTRPGMGILSSRKRMVVFLAQWRAEKKYRP